MDKEKQNLFKKKIKDKEALHKTIKDNELNKIKQVETLRKEREDDIRCTEEYAKILEKQENERKEYFKKIERNANNFTAKMVGTVLKDMSNKNREEEEKMKKYQVDKETRYLLITIRDQEEDERRKTQLLDNRKMIRSYLDMQVEDKKRMNDFERTLNSEQARIWKTDTHRFYEQEKEIHDKVRQCNIMNSDYLKTQINLKRNGQIKMTDHEYALNRNLLENIKLGD